MQNDAEFLEYLHNFDLSQTIGLFNGSLYDMLTDVYPGSGVMNTSATGFEVTCGYLPGVNLPHGGGGDIAARSPSRRIRQLFDGSTTNEYNISFGSFGWSMVPVPGNGSIVHRLR